MITHHVPCKFCGRTCDVVVDPKGARYFGDLEDFARGMCACNRCADLRDWMSRAVTMIDGYKWSQEAPLEERRAKVAHIAQKIARKVCGHYRVRETFSPELVDLFMGKRADKVARIYENEIRRNLDMNPLALFDPAPTPDTTNHEPAPDPEYLQAPEFA